MKTENKLLALLGIGLGYITYNKVNSNNKDNALILLNKWMKNINTHDVNSVVSLYSKKAILLQIQP